MGTLHLVRHGQASFGADDYDRLSPLGHQQCQRLGAHFAQQGKHFEAVLTGSLRRHRETHEGIAHGLAGLPAPLVWPGLNEYDSQAIVRAVYQGDMPPSNTAEGVKQHFRLLRSGLLAWMGAQVQPVGMPSFDDFCAGVRGALDHVRQTHSGDVLIVSSGGPISVAIGLVLGLAPEAIVALNLRLRNSAVSEFSFNPKQHQLLTFNTLPHLDQPGLADWVTYS
jgi:broad specificity phosphatase PhoE